MKVKLDRLDGDVLNSYLPVSVEPTNTYAIGAAYALVLRLWGKAMLRQGTHCRLRVS